MRVNCKRTVKLVKIIISLFVFKTICTCICKTICICLLSCTLNIKHFLFIMIYLQVWLFVQMSTQIITLKIPVCDTIWKNLPHSENLTFALNLHFSEPFFSLTPDFSNHPKLVMYLNMTCQRHVASALQQAFAGDPGDLALVGIALEAEAYPVFSMICFFFLFSFPSCLFLFSVIFFSFFPLFSPFLTL